jgi:predicted glutamine amidotransferase
MIMCKIFAMTNVTKVKVSKELLNVVRDAVCRLSDRDGFGYAVNTLDGQLWGERTTNPFDLDALAHKPVNMTNQLPIVSAQNSFGPKDAVNNVSFIAHGRMSTNQVNIQNTHPFVNKQVALIHNGVVSDPHGAVSGLTTNCDTEILLKLWEQGEIEAIEEHAAGYYAVALLDTSGQLHIVRDSRASLFIAYSETVDSYLIATTETIIKEIAKNMNWKVEEVQPIVDNVYAVFSGNDILSYEEIYPLGYGYGIDESKVATALGQSKEISQFNDIPSDDVPRDWESLSALDNYTMACDDDSPDLSDGIEYADVVDLINRRRMG